MRCRLMESATVLRNRGDVAGMRRGVPNVCDQAFRAGESVRRAALGRLSGQ